MLPLSPSQTSVNQRIYLFIKTVQRATSSTKNLHLPGEQVRGHGIHNQEKHAWFWLLFCLQSLIQEYCWHVNFLIYAEIKASAQARPDCLDSPYGCCWDFTAATGPDGAGCTGEYRKTVKNWYLSHTGFQWVPKMIDINQRLKVKSYLYVALLTRMVFVALFSLRTKK